MWNHMYAQNFIITVLGKMSHVFCPIQTKKQMSDKNVPAEMSRFLQYKA